MQTFAIVERKIGRSLLDCVDLKPGPDTVRAWLDYLGREVEVWVPSRELYCEITLDILNHYRTPQTFRAEKSDLWPYVDTYQRLYLNQLFPSARNDEIAALDKAYLSRLLSPTETVYARAREVLLFCDGVQVMDPFIPLMSGQAFSTAWSKVNDPAFFAMPIPPATVLAEVLAEAVSTESYDYKKTWISCLQEAIELLPLLHAGHVRLTPGSRLAQWNVRRIFHKKEQCEFLLDAMANQMSHMDGADNVTGLHSVLRAGQGIIDASAFDHSAPFFFSSNELKNAQTLLQKGFANALGISRVQARLANLSTLASVDVGKVSQADLLAIRSHEETFEQWRSFRREMAEICLRNSTEDEILDARDDLTSRWRNTLRHERKKQSFVARNLRKQGLLYGAVGAVVAGGGAALTSPVTLPAMLLLAVGGALSGGGVQFANQWLRERRPDQLRKSAMLAFERHLLAIDRTPEAELQ